MKQPETAPNAHDIADQLHIIRASTLFDPGHYTLQARDLPKDTDPLVDFCDRGWRVGLRPNPFFDPAYYLARNPDIATSGVNPLLHYIQFGDREGRDPSPLFHAAWYRESYGIPEAQNALADYLARRRTGKVSPVPLFDSRWYLDHNPDVAASGNDPFEHFCAFGASELRDPCPDFDIAFYAARYATEIAGGNPFLHYLAHRDGGFQPVRPTAERLIVGAVRAATRPADSFEPRQPLPAGAPRLATVLAYYLPQFHTIPENDAWWGTGFTEWTNLARATPRFAGHYQPRAPRDLGFYSLDDPSVMLRQITMAKEAGLGGFVFYYYWFNRRRLLDKPVERFLADPSLDMKFCLMWANENWTRRWDGLEREILLAQDYLPQDDTALVDDFARHFADPRYIRLEGRPLLMIYRAALIPDPEATIARWRRLFMDRHGEDPLLFMAQSFHDYDPRRHGLDGAVEFPPHKLVVDTPKLNASLDLFDPEFSADVYHYNDIVATSLADPDPAFPLIRTAVTGWDNDPRREGAGVVLHDATPATYQAWLAALIERARRNPVQGEPIVCINAWNEWAEGAYLEPDLHYGAAFLNATARAIAGRAAAGAAPNILLVGHDALPHGAQMLLLHLARTLRREHGIVPRILLLSGGELVPDYEAEGIVDLAPNEAALQRHVASYRALGIDAAIVNSLASARVCIPLAEQGLRGVLLVHEMPRLVEEKSLRGVARQGMRAAAATVFSSEHVRDTLCAALDIAPAAHVVPQGNYQNVSYDAAARKRFRASHGIPPGAFVVLGVGFGDLRKGFDLFLQVFRLLVTTRRDIHFIWLGETHLWVRDYLGTEIDAARETGRFQLLPFTSDVAPAYCGADLYALTSREDPLPTTVIEAMSAGLPAIAFAGAGGIPDLLRETGAGASVPAGDVAAFAAATAARLDHAALAADRPRISAEAARRFDFNAYARHLLALAKPDLVRISCFVTNYNYEQHLPRRLAGIFGQTYPVEDITLFDDASTDNSVKVARETAATWRRSLSIRTNASNTGSPFGQWREAAEKARGTFVWIAEADDDAAPGLLAALVDALAAAPDAVMAIADSRSIDADGNPLMPDYRRYYLEAGAPELATSMTMGAREFATRFLAVRNLVLNVSGVLFRRDSLLASLSRLGDELPTFRLAGDWRLYLDMLAHAAGNVVWVAEPLNIHRRHEAGATGTLAAAAHLEEIARIHDIADRLLDLDDDIRAAQRRWRDEFAHRARPSAGSATSARGTGQKAPRGSARRS
ncbi:glycoside hydrolase family 99-like domain-containing protein [Acidiphilium sp. C61]|jgi:glycosyltransferase involved in cell wall biosynthesis|uniref:glycoside hydrolase family 99-like domain-containing protein n=1 Tax=Acidiphilium sp. C61 TaxID=1671485 RepID=UPI00157A40C3|nr:glycoside hydrolase family 99-like domain-containing protein [Acidiphilium sp. C61]